MQKKINLVTIKNRKEEANERQCEGNTTLKLYSSFGLFNEA